MSSSATNYRLPASMGTTARATTRFGDFPPGSGRKTEDERSSQGSTIGQSFGNGGGSNWKATSGIWGTSLGGAFTQRDNSRSQVEDEQYLERKLSGSSALADTSEADPWLNRTSGPWNPETTSPTMSMSHASGSASPVRHRGTNQAATPQTLSELHNTSPYFTRPNAIGQGSSYTGKSQPQMQSGLDPTSGSFKNQMPMFGSLDDNENTAFNGAYELDNSARGLKMDPRSVQSATFLNVSGGGTSRDSSMPPSRQSEAASIASTNSAYGLPTQFSSFGHTPNNSLNFHRPSFSNQTSGQSLRNSYSDIAPQTQAIDLSTNLARLSVGDRDMANNQAFQNTAANDFQYEAMQNISRQIGPGQVQFNGAAPVWQTDLNNIRNIGTFTPSGYSEVPFAHQFTTYREPRYNNRESISPAGSDVRRGPSSPHFYNTPPALDLHRPSSRDLRQHSSSVSADISNRLQRTSLPQQFFPQSSLYDNQYAQYAQYPYDNFNHGGYRPLPAPFGYQAMGQYSHTPTAPKAHIRDHDSGHGVRSLLLEEFRSNSKMNKRYELRDIYHHIVEFSGDQHGSRFIQQKLETANSDEKEQIFGEIQQNALQLMTDVFGNYVVQKMFEHGSQVQKRVLAEKMKNHVSELSSQTYGCRVVQKALEHVLTNQQAELVRELQPNILKCVKDQNGNHVIQKAIERVPTEHIQFIIEAFKGQVHTLATHPYGCRVIQRILEFCSDKDQALIMEELHQCAAMLITDQYGNYVTQHVISSGKPVDRSKIIKIVTSQVVALSRHKFASNVVEKSIQFGTNEEKRAIVKNLTTFGSDGIIPVQLLMKDQYGNYVIQKLLFQLKGVDHAEFVEALKQPLIALKKYNYGKQISAIEKHVFPNSSSNHFSGSLQTPSGPSDAITPPQNIPTTSTTPTPVLTMETSSPQSSSLPSVEGSTVDGPVHDSTAEAAMSGKAVSEIKIEDF